MKTVNVPFISSKHFFFCFLLLNLTLPLTSCSDDAINDIEEVELLASDKNEEPDPDDRH